MIMKRNEPYSLYCGLCDLLECCTPQEMNEYREHIVNVKVLITEKMNKANGSIQ